MLSMICLICLHAYIVRTPNLHARVGVVMVDVGVVVGIVSLTVVCFVVAVGGGGFIVIVSVTYIG